MRESFSQYTRTARERAEAFSSYIINDLDMLSSDKDEILHMMLVQFKNDLDEMCDNFKNKHGENMTEMNYFTFLIKMQAENVKLCDTFSELVIPLMSYNLFDNEDPRNLIKQCPNCKLIWYKTEGCDGETKCGNREWDVKSPSSIKAMFKYVVNWVNGKINVQKNQVQYEPTTPTPANTTSPTAVGCDYAMVWKDLPKLDDQLIFTLYSVTTMEQAKTIIRSERFRDARMNYERNIDTKFHT
ncbi:hypothetical protein HA402_015168 [Bradysia odoriphaga]|nr:hypothetical protein HA402_015168 [Bradysia odoriphaga]